MEREVSRTGKKGRGEKKIEERKGEGNEREERKIK